VVAEPKLENYLVIKLKFEAKLTNTAIIFAKFNMEMDK
jgi:hypothetical protein